MVERRKRPPVPSVQRLEVFGLPRLLEGEDRAHYDEFLARIYTAIKPADPIEEMFVVDVMSLQWELGRWWRLKFCLLNARGLRELRDFLDGKLEFHQHYKLFEQSLAEAIEQNLPAEEAQELTRRYVYDD